jgi:hypothetical protein
MWAHSNPRPQLPGQAWPSLAGPQRQGAARAQLRVVTTHECVQRVRRGTELNGSPAA